MTKQELLNIISAIYDDEKAIKFISVQESVLPEDTKTSMNIIISNYHTTTTTTNESEVI